MKPLVDQLKQGKTPGDQIPGIRCAVFKERLRNSDARHGQRGGYRVIYYVRTPQSIFLVYIHAKTEMEVLEAEMIRRMIEDIDL